jgi:DNA gyrase subunit A
LIDGQGNFGSIDGDSPAAMRYTEARLSEAGEELLRDLSKKTVDYRPNYDDRLDEPEVLPSGLPNLLINGASGVAVGVSTEIPPHNPGEVIDGTIHLINNPDADVAELMEHIPAPDFPTGGTIVGRAGLQEAYESGKGKIRVRAKYDIEEDSSGDSIIVKEIPYQVKKSRFVERIANKVEKDEISNVKDIRDESDRNGIRIVIELNNRANTRVIENKLLDDVFEKTVSIINLALVDDEPRVLSLKEILQHYIDHRSEVIRRRSEAELEEKQNRAHILEGRLTAIKNAEEIVEIIQNAEDRTKAKEALKERFGFSQDQTDHIARMQLGSLTSLEVDEVNEEYKEVNSRISRLEEILENRDELLGVVKKELREAKENFDDERRTDITADTTTVEEEDLIPQEDIVVVLTEEGYLKRMSLSEFDTQKRSGKGVIGTKLKQGDAVARQQIVNTHDHVLFLTNQGNIYKQKGYQLPDYSRTARGTPSVNMFELSDEEEITTILSVTDESFESEKELAMLTENGKIKRSPLDEFQNIQRTGIRAITLEQGDSLSEAKVLTDNSDTVFVSTNSGRSIRFSIENVRQTGRSSKGVNSVKLGEDETAIDFTVIPQDASGCVLTLSKNGYGKQTDISEYRPQSRYGKGIINIKTTDRNGDAVAVEYTTGDEHLVIMTKNGQIMRTSVGEISKMGRNTAGVKIMTVESDDEIADVTVYRETPSESE